MKSQIIVISESEKYIIKRNTNTEFFLKIKKNKNEYNYLIKMTKDIPVKEKNKIYKFCQYQKIPKQAGKIFTPFEGLSFGNGYFLIRNIYYKNLGTPVQ